MTESLILAMFNFCVSSYQIQCLKFMIVDFCELLYEMTIQTSESTDVNIYVILHCIELL